MLDQLQDEVRIYIYIYIERELCKYKSRYIKICIYKYKYIYTARGEPSSCSTNCRTRSYSWCIYIYMCRSICRHIDMQIYVDTHIYVDIYIRRGGNLLHAWPVAGRGAAANFEISRFLYILYIHIYIISFTRIYIYMHSRTT